MDDYYKKIVDRIEKRRKAVGISQIELAKQAGYGKSYYDDLKSQREGKRYNVEFLNAIAKVLECDISLFFSDSSGQLVPVVGYVGAGGAVMPIDDNPKGYGIDEVEAPTGFDPDSIIAVRVKGDSMMPFMKEGWLLFYRKEHEGINGNCVGNLCIVKLKDGRMLSKILRKGSVPGKYDLYSYNMDVIENADIEWCAPVLDIRPKL